jgi:tripartite ATP-independent transporter DctM subunit
MSVEMITLVLFVAMAVGLISGLPIAFVLGSIAVFFSYLVVGPNFVGMVMNGMFRLMNTYTFLALPFFLFMANILERSGVADDLYSMMHRWFGPVPGGLAIGTVIICTIFAAMSGVSAAATVTMGLIALPAMIKRGYDKRLSVGAIAAGGGLGQLIPPSTIMITWALFSGESVGQMFIGGIIPGLILSGLYIAYISIRCFTQPKVGPPIAKEERLGWKDKIISLKAVILPIFIILGVLGTIFAGIATPTEAAAVGSLASIISAVIYRRLNWENVIIALLGTLKTTCMVLWLAIAGSAFATTFIVIGGQEFVKNAILGLEANPWTVIIGMQAVYLFLGCLLEPMAMIMITIPVFLPVVEALGFSTLWFGVLFVMNMEIGFLTPPFGMNLFYMKAIAPKEITMVDIYRSVVPFIALQLVGMAICLAFPMTILYLPNMVFGR